MKTGELRMKSPDELRHELSETEARLFNLRMDLATRKSTAHHEVRAARRHVARLYTLLAEAERGKEVSDA